MYILYHLPARGSVLSQSRPQIQNGIRNIQGLMCVFSCSVMSDPFVTPRTVALQAPLSTEFSRQEHWSGFPFPSPGDLPDPGIELTSLVSPALAVRFFTTVPPGKNTHYPLWDQVSNYIGVRTGEF